MADDFQARFGGDAKGLEVTIQNVRKRLKELQSDLLKSTDPQTTIRLRNEAEKLRDALSAANKVGKTFGDTFKGQLAQLGAGFFAANKIISGFNKLVNDAIDNSESLKKTTDRVNNSYKSFAGNLGDVVAGLDNFLGVSNDIVDSLSLFSSVVGTLNIAAGDQNSGFRQFVTDVIKSVNPLTSAVNSIGGISRALGYGEINVGNSQGRFDFSTVQKRRKKAIDDAKENIKAAKELNDQLKNFNRVEAFPDTGFNPIAPIRGGLLPLDVSQIRNQQTRLGGSESGLRDIRGIRAEALATEEGLAKARTDFSNAMMDISSQFTDDIANGLVFNAGKKFGDVMNNVALSFVARLLGSGLDSLFGGAPTGLFGSVVKVLGGIFSAGGSDFITSKPTLMLVGDNPGNRERVTVEPLSGTGRTRLFGNHGIAMAGGGNLYTGNAPSQAVSSIGSGSQRVVIQPVLMIDGEQLYGNLSSPNGGIERYTQRVVAN